MELGAPALSHHRPTKTQRTWEPEGTSEMVSFHVLVGREAQSAMLRAVPPHKTPALLLLPFFLRYRLHFGHFRDKK